MVNFVSIKSLLDALSTEDLISTGEYISHRLDSQLATTPITKSNKKTVSRNTTSQFTTNPLSLLDLPRELRDLILSHAVQSSSPHSSLHDGSKYYPQLHLPPLTHTNQQLRSEIAEHFFSQHTFVLWGDARFGRLAKLLSISGNVWNKFVKTVVLMPDGPFHRGTPWNVFDSNWSARQTRERKVEGGFGDGVVWTGMRRAGFGKELGMKLLGRRLWRRESR